MSSPSTPASPAAPDTIACAADQLSEAERHLVDCVLRGEPCDLKRRTVRASVLRDLVLETHPGWVVPHAGVRITRGIVDGGLDLEGCVLTKPLLFWHCRIQGGGDRGAVVVRDAKLKRLGIHSSTVDGSIVADRAQIESGFFLGGGLVRGVLQIRGADVTGALAIEGTEIGDGKAAILGAGLRVSGPLILRRTRISGEVALPRAELGAGIYAEEAAISHASVALNLESVRADGDVLLDRAKITGSIRLSNARIAGRISAESLTVTSQPDAILAGGVNVAQGVTLAGATITGSVWIEGADIGKVFRCESLTVEGGETAIGADLVKVGGNWDLKGAKLVGLLSCPGADIAGQLRMTEARLFGHDIAMRADGTRVRGGLFLTRAMIVGLLRFPACEFGNQFRLRGASLRVDQGAALLASGSTFHRDLELDGGLQALGALVLDQIKVRGTLDLSGSSLKSSFLARGATPPPSLPEQGRDAAQRADELALSLIDAEIDRLVLPDEAERRPRGVVDLSRAHVASFEDYAATWPPGPAIRGRSEDGRDVDHQVLDGFTYDQLTNPSGAPRTGGEPRRESVAKRRIAWLEGQPERDVAGHFKPHAWVQLGRRLAAAGYRDDARTLAIARLRRERRSRSATFAQRWQGRLLDLFALYGYNPWRTVAWMTLLVVMFSGVWSWAGRQCATPGCFDETVMVVTNRDAYTPERFAEHYPEFHPLAYSFDLFVPFLPIGYEDHWRPNLAYREFAHIPLPRLARSTVAGEGTPGETQTLAISVGGLLYVMGIVEMILGLVLTSLAITGFTGLLKGDDSP